MVAERRLEMAAEAVRGGEVARGVPFGSPIFFWELGVGRNDAIRILGFGIISVLLSRIAI